MPARLCFIALVLIFVATPRPGAAAKHEPAGPCASAQTQLALNQCFAGRAKQADVIVAGSMAKLQAATPAAKAKFASAQNAWIAYRNAECAAEAAQYGGGSIAPMIVSQCYARMAQSRTAELRFVLQQLKEH